MDSKVCTKCGVDKLLEEYHKHQSGKLGRYPMCKPCRKAYRADKHVGIAKERDNERSRNWAENNRDTARDRASKWYEENPDRAKASMARWRTENLGKSNADKAKYRANRMQRTPPWAALEAIEQFYIDRPDGYHGDHEIPLQGELVSGLHVLGNLQYLTARENMSKGNSFNPDDWYWVKEADQ